MFRDIPGCSMFLVLSTVINTGSGICVRFELLCTPFAHVIAGSYKKGLRSPLRARDVCLQPLQPDFLYPG